MGKVKRANLTPNELERLKAREREYYLKKRNPKISYEADLMKLLYPSYFAYNLKLELQGEFYCKNDLMEFLGMDYWKSIEGAFNKNKVIGNGLGYLVKTHRITLTAVSQVEQVEQSETQAA